MSLNHYLCSAKIYRPLVRWTDVSLVDPLAV